jgi:hypothetical protein
VPLLDYATQVSELEKIARLAPAPPVTRELPELAHAEPEATCLVCGASPARRCGACAGVCYCGPVCQRLDARWHDLVCAELAAIAEDAAFAEQQSRAGLADALIERIGRVSIAGLTGWDAVLEPGPSGARRRALSELGSRPLTLARVLADLDIPAQTGKSGVVAVHVMAAARREREVPPALWATLARLFPGTRFELTLVGPELDELFTFESADSPVVIRAQQSLYRREQWRELGRPDLIIGYNCGLTLYPSWKATILELRGSGVPFVTTSYRPWEAAAEARLLAAVRVTCVRGPTPNPFASLASRRSTTIANDVARDNAWIAVWR